MGLKMYDARPSTNSSAMFTVATDRVGRRRRGRAPSSGGGGFSFIRRLTNRHSKMQKATATSLPPMPAEEVLLKQFDSVMKKMDLPPDKARVLRNYDNQKKWELVCDQMKMADEIEPSVYLEKLQAYLDKRTLKKKKKLLGDETSTVLLKHLEISLRTNSIDWVRSFLDEKHNGLRVLVDYLGQIQDAGGLPDPPPQPSMSTAHLNGDLPNGSISRAESFKKGDDQPCSTAAAGGNGMTTSTSVANGHVRRPSANFLMNSKNKSLTKNIGIPEEDIHVCVQCLRAIMNNKYGFNMVFSDQEAIYCIVRSILHRSLRTKALVLELLAAISLVKGGHELITDAFDRFKTEYGERRRFQTLMWFFKNPGDFHVDYMVACMQFINIVVHSVEDMNYRIFLQYEFTQLGLDHYLEQLKLHESDQLHVQISAYLENMFDVGQLIEDSEMKASLHTDNEHLTHQLSATNERLQEVEADYINRIAGLDTRLRELMRERDKLYDLHKRTDTEVHTLRKTLTEKEKESRQQQIHLEERIAELETLQKSLSSGLATPFTPPRSSGTTTTGGEQQSSPVSRATPTPPPPSDPSNTHHSTSSHVIASPPPPAPPLPSTGPPPVPAARAVGGPPPPPPPPPPPSSLLAGGPAANDVMTIKRTHQPRNKLPQLNWMALKPNQVKGTVFNDLDDDKVTELIDFGPLEELFKLGEANRRLGGAASNAASTTAITSQSNVLSPRKETLLDQKRIQNIAITRRKLAMQPNEIMYAVHRFDMKELPPDSVDMLLRIAPKTDEIQAFKEYEAKQKPLSGLTEEDQFMAQLAKIERLEHKLKIMCFMGGFVESADLLDPQFTTLTAASKCARDAELFHKVLEIILAFGNYMNSSRRGGVYGFKLSSLDSLAVLKSPSDRSLTLMHLIAQTVHDKFPELLNFTDEFKFAEKASGVILENILADMKELETGYELSKKERELKGQDCPQALVEFLHNCQGRMENLQTNCRLASEAFWSCVEFYGESPRSQQPNTFFARLSSFSKNFTAAVAANAERAKAEQRALEEQQRREKAAAIRGKQLAEGDMRPQLNAELEERLGNDRRQKMRENRIASKLDRNQIADGDFEKIMNAMKDGEYDTFQGPATIGAKRLSSLTAAGGGSNPPPTAPKTRRLANLNDRNRPTPTAV